MKHVYVIDDNEVMGSTLERTLVRLGYTAEVYQDPLAFLAQSQPISPAVILLDMRMPSMSGVQLQAALTSAHRHTPIVFISGESLSSEIVQGMKQGAVDFLFKPFKLEDLLTALEEALARDFIQATSLSKQQSVSVCYNTLTQREKEVCNLLVQGFLSKHVADVLGISTATVKVHKARIMEKMKASTLQQLALDMALLPHP